MRALNENEEGATCPSREGMRERENYDSLLLGVGSRLFVYKQSRNNEGGREKISSIAGDG